MRPVKNVFDACEAASAAMKGGLIAQNAVGSFRLGKGEAKEITKGENKGGIKVTLEVVIFPIKDEDSA